VSDRVSLPALLFADGANGHLHGGGGSTVEVGGGGNNTHLEDGKGRNLLIAGSGAAHLEGGGDGDILIGGSTNVDHNEPALLALMAEWTHTYDSNNALNDYRIRVGHLLNGSGLNGLNGLNVLLNTFGVHDNGVQDHLDGGDGLDLFFASLGGSKHDKLDGVEPRDVVVDLGP
jgi:hypothetical protein